MTQEKDTVDYTIRGFTKDFDNTLTNLSILWGKPKSVILRELAELHLTNRIKTFGMLSKHVAALDELLAKHFDMEFLAQQFDSHLSTQWNMEICKILSINTDEDLERILVNNTPYITARGKQVLQHSRYITRGMSLWFALFAEIASSSPETIKLAWTKVFHAGGNERYYKYYNNINEIRALKSMPTIPADKNDVTHEGEFCSVTVSKPAHYDYGAWQAVITLNQNIAKAVNQDAKVGLCFPKVPARLFTIGKGSNYRHVAYREGKEPESGFTFIDSRSEIDIYSNGCSEDNNPTSLNSVAKALAEVTDEHVKLLML